MTFSECFINSDNTLCVYVLKENPKYSILIKTSTGKCILPSLF